MAETTGRVLQLLGLLQSRRVWSGDQLAERLGVTTRSVRRDVERLRDLGYPVHASKGHGGGYRLGAGAALPPLLLDADEAVAVAVCLRLAAGGSVAGVGEAALRALTKLDQVLPARLRSQVGAVHDATVTLTREPTDSVEPDVLMTLARACRDHEHVAAEYVDRGGRATSRRLEPYQLVTTGRRWYLMAYDRDRQDWRSLRLDRMDDVRAVGSRSRRATHRTRPRSWGVRSPRRRTGWSHGFGILHRTILLRNTFHQDRRRSSRTARTPAW